MPADSGRHRGVVPRPVPPPTHPTNRYAAPGGAPTPGAAPAATTAPTAPSDSTPPDAGSSAAATSTAEGLLLRVRQLCEAYTNARLAHVAAVDAPSEAERAHYQARADYWNQTTNVRYRDLTETMADLLPEPAHLERFMPIRPLTNGHLELHAHDRQARPVVVLLTGAQALAVSAHLGAYAAISLDRTGTKVDNLLPPVKAAPPFTTGGDPPAEGAPGRP